MADNRVVINNHLRRARGGKISYTHLIGYAIVKALADNPEMNTHFAEIDGRPTLVTPEHVNLGIAIDLVGKDNARSLIVANIKRAETMSFAEFWSAYEDIIRRAQSGEFLRRVHELLLADEFYDEIFAALRIPYEPVRWLVDREFTHEGQIDKSARVIELINAYRTNGHLMADTDPLEYTVR